MGISLIQPRPDLGEIPRGHMTVAGYVVFHNQDFRTSISCPNTMRWPSIVVTTISLIP